MFGLSFSIKIIKIGMQNAVRGLISFAEPIRLAISKMISNRLILVFLLIAPAIVLTMPLKAGYMGAGQDGIECGHVPVPDTCSVLSINKRGAEWRALGEARTPCRFSPVSKVRSSSQLFAEAEIVVDAVPLFSWAKTALLSTEGIPPAALFFWESLTSLSDFWSAIGREGVPPIQPEGEEKLAVFTEPVIHLYRESEEFLVFWNLNGHLSTLPAYEAGDIDVPSGFIPEQWQDLRLGWRTSDNKLLQADIGDSGSDGSPFDDSEPDPLLDFLNLICKKGSIVGRIRDGNGKIRYVYMDSIGQLHTISRDELNWLYSNYYDQLLEAELTGGLPAGGGEVPEVWHGEQRPVPWPVLHQLSRLAEELEPERIKPERKGGPDFHKVLPPEEGVSFITRLADNPGKSTPTFSKGKLRKGKGDERLPTEAGAKKGEKSTENPLSNAGSVTTSLPGKENKRLKTRIEGLVFCDYGADDCENLRCHKCKNFLFDTNYNAEKQKVILCLSLFQNEGDRICEHCKSQLGSTASPFPDVSQKNYIFERLFTKHDITLWWKEAEVVFSEVGKKTKYLELNINVENEAFVKQAEDRRVLDRLNGLEALCEQLQTANTVLKSKVAALEAKQSAAGTGLLTGSSSDVRGSLRQGQGGDFQRKLSQLNEIITQLVTDVEQQKGTVAQLSTNLDTVTSAVPRYDTILEELNLKIEILEVKSTSGTYVWKVNDLSRRMREARMGRTLSLYSPPFYSSPHGYRVCLRGYLNGDGTGRGTHISLYIVIMKGEYDDLLTWPIAHEVTLSLINQNDPERPDKSITHKFTPNPSSSSFQKPKDTFNIASGFPEFAPVSVLNDPLFVRADTMYFRVRLTPPDEPTGPDDREYYDRR